MDLEQFFRDASEQVGETLPEDASVAFVLDGAGGGQWTLRRDGVAVNLVSRADTDVDCRLVCSLADFRRVIDGELDARDAFLAGRLRLEGDVGLMLNLQEAFKVG